MEIHDFEEATLKQEISPGYQIVNIFAEGPIGQHFFRQAHDPISELWISQISHLRLTSDRLQVFICQISNLVSNIDTNASKTPKLRIGQNYLTWPTTKRQTILLRHISCSPSRAETSLHRTSSAGPTSVQSSLKGVCLHLCLSSCNISRVRNHLCCLIATFRLLVLPICWSWYIRRYTRLCSKNGSLAKFKSVPGFFRIVNYKRNPY